MQHIEVLQNQMINNMVKTDLIISQLHNIEGSIVNSLPELKLPRINVSHSAKSKQNSSNLLEEQLRKLDRKVSGIDTKLEGLKVQIDNNFLQVEELYGEASEKKPVTISVHDISKALNTEAMTHISSELNEFRHTTEGIDKKIQFHINMVSESIGRIIRMLHDIHFAVVDNHEQFNTFNITTTSQPPVKSSKLDALVKQIRPMVLVSEKMDEVWDVVVGTKSTVEHLLPKSEALLTQTQRQERAIDEIHQDLKTKTNLIINNLDMVEKRLKKKESDEQIIAELSEPHSSDHFNEYESNNHTVIDKTLKETTFNASGSYSYVQPSTVNSDSPALFTSTSGDEIMTPLRSTFYNGNTSNTQEGLINGSYTGSDTAGGYPTASKIIRKDGLIFPSIKNKPSIINNSITSDIIALKDIKGFSCADLMSAGMKKSGVFYLQIRGTTYWFLKVYCDQETTEGGWTVIQRRDEFGEPRENFNRDWSDYKNGFGEPSKEFWLGNENIYMLTNNEEYTLRIELEDFEGNKRYAQYSHFKIHSEADYYKLEIDGYEGNAGDSLNDPWYGSNNSPFSTYNKDNDRSSLNCASMLKGGWWWKSCGRGLNGLYLHDPQDITARQGIVWFRWRGWDYTLKKSTMMIRPKISQLTSMSGNSM
nr:angiopoietin-4 isoform X2 [Drosophila kikkawai]